MIPQTTREIFGTPNDEDLKIIESHGLEVELPTDIPSELKPYIEIAYSIIYVGYDQKLSLDLVTKAYNYLNSEEIKPIIENMADFYGLLKGIARKYNLESSEQ